MSNMSNTPRGMPSMGSPTPPGMGVPGTGNTVTVATYPDYQQAQRAVDYLSDDNFPVERVAIIGTGLRTVENVLGRLTVGKAALAGAASGAWFGLFVGVLLGLFSVSDWWKVILSTVLIGVFWFALFGAIAQAMTNGRRDFTSRSSLQATEYGISVDAAYADQATQLLARL
jgi:hypothetical protein